MFQKSVAVGFHVFACFIRQRCQQNQPKHFYPNTELKPSQMSETKPRFPSLHVFTIFLLLLLLLLLLSYANSQLEDQEEAVLLRLKQYWQNPPSLSLWTSSNTSHCTWPGVTCTKNSVTALHLGNYNITGTFPPFITDLQNLTVLDFFNNSIYGNFPTALYNLPKLEYLDLSQNYFVGSIPADIDHMARLSVLNLSYNNFSNSIPPAIGKLLQLTSLQLNGNLFNGTFPLEISNLSNLEILRLAYNGFVLQSLPSNFTMLRNLKEMWISDANLIGGIPEEIGEMVALETLDLSSNNLTGNIPSSLFLLKNLSVLFLYKNQLSGEIPPVVEALNLTVIDLSANRLNGTIPDDFGKLEKLTGLALFFNQLSGEIPESIGRLPALQDFNLFTNNLSGALPPDFGRYSNLRNFQVASNGLNGTLPEYLCSSGSLVGLVAFDNDLSGELPASLGNCNSLTTVMLSNNRFSGNIPPGLWTAFNLSSLMINDNSFTGELPKEVSQNLSRLEISNNRISGEIPIDMSSWMKLVVFNASNNLFTGTIPQGLTALPHLTTLFLGQNQLSGSIPSDIISWNSLSTLNLSQNELSGQIPEELGSLPVLVDLDLSDNQFSGQIPSQLGLLKLNFLNLSSNDLTGKIPRQFENAAYASSFLNNSGLCASSSLLLNLNPCNSTPQKSSKISTVLFSIITALTGIFLLSLLVSCLVIRIHQKRKQQSNSTWKLTPYQELNFTQSNILVELTERNVIGKGGSGIVYRVVINHPDAVVAVKRIWNNRKLNQKLEMEFLAEAEILGGIKHLNIVKLLCNISNDNTKLLVYEYMEKGNLYEWLHMKKRLGNVSGAFQRDVLDWPKRLQIAVGAAQGLCYMHHDCVRPIVHRDVKSSNILLDFEFKAKIADFGLAKMLMKPGESGTVSSVAGSFGYMAPECAHSFKVNEMVDVYSFGIILLELVTGKEANYGDENVCLADWSLRHIEQGKPIEDALDEEIKKDCYLDEMTAVFFLGIRCTKKLPSSRPSMREVLEILHHIGHRDFYWQKNAGSENIGSPLLKQSKRERMSDSEDDICLVSNV